MFLQKPKVRRRVEVLNKAYFSVCVVKMSDEPGNSRSESPKTLTSKTCGEINNPTPGGSQTLVFVSIPENSEPGNVESVSTQCGSYLTVDEENIVVLVKCLSPQPVEEEEKEVDGCETADDKVN